MDYSFRAGSAGFYALLARYFARRGNTTDIAPNATRNTIREFIKHLDSTASVTKPIGDMLLGTHANSQGYLEALVYDRQIGDTGYEVMEDSETGAIGSYTTTPDITLTSIAVPDTLIGYTPGDPITNNFHIKGCNVGRATAFLTALKSALGGNVNVTAPLHFYGLYHHPSFGIWEFMCYEIKLQVKTPFANRAAYVAALDAGGFTFFDGTAIPLTDFEAWVPRTITASSSVSVSPNLGTPVGTRTTISVNREFRYRRRAYTFTITYGAASQVPGTASAQMAELTAAVDTAKYRDSDTIEMFDSSHPYPEYERYGYASKADFLSEQDWTFQKVGKKLVCTGRASVYTLIIPIMDMAAANLGNIVFNYHPNAGSPNPAITTGLVETDTNFFATV